MSPFELPEESGEIQAGDHDVEIVEAVATTNKNTGNDQLRVTFEDPSGAQITDWLVHKPTVAWKWRQLWEAAGLPWTGTGGKVKVDEADLVGRRVHIDVINDTYEGRTRAKVREVSPYVGSDIPSELPDAGAPKDDSEVPF